MKDTLKNVVLALQHMIAMFGATVLVPYLTGLNPSVALFTAGLGTLVFHLCTKGKVPVFLGSSFAFIPIVLTVKEMYNGDLAYALGGTFAAGLAYVVLSFLVERIGVERIQKVLTPQVVGPMIVVIGLSLVPVAFDMASQHFVVATITLLTALAINLFGKGFFKQLSIIIGVAVGYLISYWIGLVDTSAISQSALFAIPPFMFPKFDLGAILVTLPVVLAVLMEHVGDITTNGHVVSKNFVKDPGLNRTLLGDGLASAIAAVFGGPANTTYGENTGVLAITKNYNPVILRLAAVFAITLGFVAKLGAILTSIPSAVMGGISLILFSMIAWIGVKTIKDSKIKFNWRNIIVMLAILVIGLGGNFGLSIAISITETVQLSGLSLAAIVGITLNTLLPKKE